MISVLIPSRTDAYLKRVLEALLYHGGFGGVSPRRIIVGDNGLSERPVHPSIVYVDVPQPFNFSGAINRCAAAAPPEHDLFILNDDALPTSFYFPIWVEHAIKWGMEQGFGLTGPRIEGGVGNEDQRRETTMGQFVQTYKPICFMAAAIPRHVWNQIGPMDERYTGYGFDDADYCRRVVEAGYRLGVAGWFAVEHGINGMPQSGTFQRIFGHDAYSEMGQRAMRIFSDKWGSGPQLGDYECKREPS